MSWIDAGFGVAILAVVICLGAYWLALLKSLRASRHDTSRFPMFAARDRLVALVASRKVRETDPAWAKSYADVNFLLRIHANYNAWDCLRQFVTFRMAYERDPVLRARFAHQRRQEESLARRVPEYEQIQKQIANAFTHMMRRRTYVHHRFLILGITVLVWWAALISRLVIALRRASTAAPANPTSRDGHRSAALVRRRSKARHVESSPNDGNWVETAKRVSRSAKHPSAADLSEWREFQNCAA